VLFALSFHLTKIKLNIYQYKQWGPHVRRISAIEMMRDEKFDHTVPKRIKRDMMRKENGNQITSSLSFAIAASTFIVSFGPWLSDFYLLICMLMFGVIMASVYGYATYIHSGSTSPNDLMAEYEIIDETELLSSCPQRKWSPFSRSKLARPFSTGSTLKRGSLTLGSSLEEDMIGGTRPRSKTTGFFHKKCSSVLST